MKDEDLILLKRVWNTRRPRLYIANQGRRMQDMRDNRDPVALYYQIRKVQETYGITLRDASDIVHGVLAPPSSNGHVHELRNQAA